jgi:hypothetical protein
VAAKVVVAGAVAAAVAAVVGAAVAGVVAVSVTVVVAVAVVVDPGPAQSCPAAESSAAERPETMER